MNRREFLAASATTAAAFSIVPRHVLGGPMYVAPNDRIRTACIGVGSQGFRVMMDFLRYDEIQIVSVCDVNRGSDVYIEWGKNELRNKVRHLIDDPNWGSYADGAICGRLPAQDIVNKYYAQKSGKADYSGCSEFVDYRELLEQEDIDAVIVGTTDHHHAPASMAAMKKGKHVFCQKPMTRTIREAREMAKVARESGVATQVATGNSASEDTRVLAEMVMDGAIGNVLEVHNWSARPFWPQGFAKLTGSYAVPDYLDWDLWIGPSPMHLYHPDYQPFVWRAFFDFGAGAIGDMGCYSFDTMFRVLDVQYPTAAEATGSIEYKAQGSIAFPVENNFTYPRATRMHFEFPARYDKKPVDIYWYDGGIKPNRPEELDKNEDMPREGMLLIGDQGKILAGFNGSNPRLIPTSKMEAYNMPPKTLPRSIGHYEEWIQACKGEGTPAANFEFAGLVTETILLGNAAYRAGEKLLWDGPNLKATNTDVSELVAPPYRAGWSL